MSAPPLIIENGYYSMDGGSIGILARRADGTRCAFDLPQHVMPANFRAERLPGRLHLNGRPVPVRSAEERALLEELRGGRYQSGASPSGGARLARPALVIGEDVQEYVRAIDEGPEAATALLVRRLLAFVESPAYEDLAGFSPCERCDGFREITSFADPPVAVCQECGHQTRPTTTLVLAPPTPPGIELYLQLEAVGPDRLRVAAVLREVTGRSPREALDLLSKEASIVLEGRGEERARLEAAQAKLAAAGARASIHRRRRPGQSGG